MIKRNTRRDVLICYNENSPCAMWSLGCQSLLSSAGSDSSPPYGLSHTVSSPPWHWCCLSSFLHVVQPSVPLILQAIIGFQLCHYSYICPSVITHTTNQSKVQNLMSKPIACGNVFSQKSCVSSCLFSSGKMMAKA